MKRSLLEWAMSRSLPCYRPGENCVWKRWSKLFYAAVLK